MKKFMFSLEKVLSFKQQTLNVKMNELGLFQMKLLELEKEINDLNKKFADTNQVMVKSLQTGLSSNDLAVYKLYFNTLNQKIQKLIEDKNRLSDIIAQKKADIIAINSEISGLEKLREKQLAEYLKVVQKSNELAMDEYVNQMRSSVS